MKSHLRVTPLSGSRSLGGLCLLLQVDDAKLLLDLGWSPALDPNDPHLKQVAQLAPHIDAVLLSHGSLRHCGALPYAMRKLGLKCPVYATFPVQTMGKHAVVDALKTRDMNVVGSRRSTRRSKRTSRRPRRRDDLDMADMDQDQDQDQDQHQDQEEHADDDDDDIRNDKDLDDDHLLFTKRDVDSVFSKITLLRYSQPFILSGKAQGTVITAFAAGHSVGGTLWKIKKDTEDIVYAVDLNHRKDAHLAPTSLFLSATDQIHPALLRPSLLIASTRLPSGIAAKTRDASLFSSITATLTRGGNVLIPTDTSTRVLELAHILEEHWHAHGLAYPVVVVSHVAPKVMYHARGMLEWYADQLTKNFASRRVHAFDFTYVKLAGGWKDLRKYPDPKVVLATDPDMDRGFARKVFLDTCNGSKRNLVIIPRKMDASATSLASVLYQSVLAGATGGQEEVLVDRRGVEIACERRVALTGDELDAYWERRRARREALLRAKQGGGADRRPEDEQDEDEDDDEQDRDATPAAASGSQAPPQSQQTAAAVTTASDPSAPPPSTALASVVHFSNSTYDAFVRDTPNARFPYVEHWRRFDEYGEVVKHEQYLTDADRIEKERAAAARRRAEQATDLDGGDGDESSSSSSGGSDDEEEGGSGEHSAMDMDHKPVRRHVPTKIVVEAIKVDLHTRVKVVDVEGLADADALAHILPMVQARAIALVGGSTQDTDVVLDRLRLAMDAQRQHEAGGEEGDEGDAGPELFAPETGDVVEPQSASYAVTQVKLTDALFTRMKMVKYGEHEIGVITAAVKAADPPVAAADAAAPVSDAADSTQVANVAESEDPMEVDANAVPSEVPVATAPRVVPVLDVVDPLHSQRHPSVVIGTVRLTDFKSVLDDHGFKTEFVRGVLVVNGKVGVYKRSNGHITVEGQVCPEYYTVRQLLYQQHVTF